MVDAMRQRRTRLQVLEHTVRVYRTHTSRHRRRGRRRRRRRRRGEGSHVWGYVGCRGSRGATEHGAGKGAGAGGVEQDDHVTGHGLAEGAEDDVGCDNEGEEVEGEGEEDNGLDPVLVVLGHDNVHSVADNEHEHHTRRHRHANRLLQARERGRRNAQLGHGAKRCIHGLDECICACTVEECGDIVREQAADRVGKDAAITVQINRANALKY